MNRCSKLRVVLCLRNTKLFNPANFVSRARVLLPFWQSLGSLPRFVAETENESCSGDCC